MRGRSLLRNCSAADAVVPGIKSTGSHTWPHPTLAKAKRKFREVKKTGAKTFHSFFPGSVWAMFHADCSPVTVMTVPEMCLETGTGV